MIALLAGLGAGGWVYSKFHHRTGGNVRNALVAGALAGVFAFIVIISLLSLLFPSS